MKVYDVFVEHYRFSEELMKDTDFVNKFKNDRDLRDNYLKLRNSFIENESDDTFYLCYKELVSNDFINFFFEDYLSALRPTNLDDCLIDPATSISYFCSLFHDEDFLRIQEALLHIYHFYGDIGLCIARESALAMGITNEPILVIEDEDDIYDLPTCEWSNPTDKLLTLSNQNFDLKQRVDDLYSSSSFRSFPDENVKSALFSFPHLIYRDGKIIDECELYALMTKISLQMEEHSNYLDYFAFDEAYEICSDIYLDSYRELLPLKSGKKNSQFTKARNTK